MVRNTISPDRQSDLTLTSVWLDCMPLCRKWSTIRKVFGENSEILVVVYPWFMVRPIPILTDSRDSGRIRNQWRFAVQSKETTFFFLGRQKRILVQRLATLHRGSRVDTTCQPAATSQEKGYVSFCAVLIFCIPFFSALLSSPAFKIFFCLLLSSV